MLLFDAIKSELEEKIRRLEEDRNNIDISSGKIPYLPQILAHLS